MALPAAIGGTGIGNSEMRTTSLLPSNKTWQQDLVCVVDVAIGGSDELDRGMHELCGDDAECQRRFNQQSHAALSASSVAEPA